LWTDGRTDGRTGRHFFPLILLGRLFEVDLTRTSATLKQRLCTAVHWNAAIFEFVRGFDHI